MDPWTNGQDWALLYALNHVGPAPQSRVPYGSGVLLLQYNAKCGSPSTFHGAVENCIIGNRAEHCA